IEMANFIGLSQAGAPVMTRGSSRSPARDTARTSSIVAPTKASGQLEDRTRPSRSRGPDTLADCAVMPQPLLTLPCVCPPSSPSPLFGEHLSLEGWSSYTSRSRSAVPVRADDVSLRPIVHDPSLRHAFSFQIPPWLVTGANIVTSQ